MSAFRNPPSFHPPPPLLGTISAGRLRSAHKITPAQLHPLYPKHSHHNIHVKKSFDFFSHSSWFAIRPFEWVPEHREQGGDEDHHCYTFWVSIFFRN